MIGLAIHTSSPELGLALMDLETRRTRSQLWPLGRDLTTYLHSCLKEFVQPHPWQDLAYIAVAKGPGGFTGTRIGVVVARTLAQQLSIPLFGISSLAAIAQHHLATVAPALDENTDLAVTLAAQRGEHFGAIFQQQTPCVAPLLEDKLFTPTAWDTQLKAWPHPCHILNAQNGLARTVTGVLELADDRWQRGDRPPWETIVPFYGQHPVQ